MFSAVVLVALSASPGAPTATTPTSTIPTAPPVVAPLAPTAPVMTVPTIFGNLPVNSRGSLVRFRSLLCADNLAAVQAALSAICRGFPVPCSVNAVCKNSRQTNSWTEAVVTGPDASVAGLVSQVQMGKVAGVPANAAITNLVVAPNGALTPSATPLTPQAPSVFLMGQTTTPIVCRNQATCASEINALLGAGYTTACTCTSVRQGMGIMNVFVNPATGLDPAAAARTLADYFKTCVNVFTAGSLTTPAASYCPGKNSKKSLLGLLGLLGLIPLLLCLALLCLCCLRRRKTSRDVHFATFDPAPNNVAMAAPVASVCAPPMASVCAPAPCGPAPVCYP